MFLEADHGETKPSIQKLQLETKIPKIESAVSSFCLNGGSHALEKEMEVELIVLTGSDDDNVTILDPPLVNEAPMVDGGTGITTGDPSCLELLTGGSDGFDLSYWDYLQAGSPAGQQFFSEEQHQVQNDATVALNRNAVGQGISSNGTSDYTEYWSSFNLQDCSDSVDLDSVNRPCPSGNLTDENSAVQPIVDAAVVLHSMNGGNSNNTQQMNRLASGSRSQSMYTTFYHPRQPGSAKCRVIISIDSDSE